VHAGEHDEATVAMNKNSTIIFNLGAVVRTIGTRENGKIKNGLARSSQDQIFVVINGELAVLLRVP
jgi:hypothetical protein